MFYSLTGKISVIDENVIAVDTGAVSFEVNCSSNTIYNLNKDGNQKVYTYMHVKEDGISLFGFSDIAEKKMFINLISVSGIGPKLAINILSATQPTTLASAVVNKEVGVLTKIKGLGKKTAERIVLELKEKVDQNIKIANSATNSVKMQVIDTNLTREMTDAIEILTNLGIKKDYATELVKAKASSQDKADEIVRKCL